MKEMIWDRAHLACVELFMPKPEKSAKFFTDITGMVVISFDARNKNRVFNKTFISYEYPVVEFY